MKVKRRSFLVGAILLGIGAAPLGRRYLRALENRAEIVIRTLCDHFVPGHGDVPGAVALGVDRRIVESFHKTRRARLRLLLLAHDLRESGFLELASEEQRVFIGEQLALAVRDSPPRQAAMIDEIYWECASDYLTNPDAWSAIRYRIPQPHGYPDYTECVAS